ncbi:conserved membrane hypothetical protein [Desulfamplus magnetovallimortis]|uniref:CysZ protein n=1 Tax=Desulfamplus magnetovallimortis TaxID=1246637 RepID=A0A1W1HDI8_9BACT|nr:EI24 domain-containing protein [Desulfamplus magnetovallimortis]SLM30540.1 conserved membrane hypothetical protein [Desulfamplus magnetovallimortis]
MSFIKGIIYNLKGLAMGLTTPSLLFLGMLRFVVVVALTIVCSGLILMWHQDILNLLWHMPESKLMLFFWNIVSWLLSLLLAAVAGLLSYFVAQILFCVFIMDYMSRITEQKVTGRVDGALSASFIGLFLHLIAQEIPRTIVPVIFMLIVMLAGLLTPLGPVITVLSSLVAGIFLAWDNTDLVPARRMESFGKRFTYLKKNLMFHMGFGICFLVPWVNIVLLSFAPVGATLYYIEKDDNS